MGKIIIGNRTGLLIEIDEADLPKHKKVLKTKIHHDGKEKFVYSDGMGDPIEVSLKTDFRTDPMAKYSYQLLEDSLEITSWSPRVDTASPELMIEDAVKRSLMHGKNGKVTFATRDGNIHDKRALFTKLFELGWRMPKPSFPHQDSMLGTSRSYTPNLTRLIRQYLSTESEIKKQGLKPLIEKEIGYQRFKDRMCGKYMFPDMPFETMMQRIQPADLYHDKNDDFILNESTLQDDFFENCLSKLTLSDAGVKALQERWRVDQPEEKAASTLQGNPASAQYQSPVFDAASQRAMAGMAGARDLTLPRAGTSAGVQKEVVAAPPVTRYPS